MEGFYKATVNLASGSGLPVDDAQNTFYFESSSAVTTTADDADTMTTLLTAFYNAVPTGGTDPIAEFIGTHISRAANACSFLYYFDPGPTPPALWGSPDEIRSWTIGANAGGSMLPAEVAFALSFHGDLTDIPETAPNPTPPPATIRPAARRKGRVFLGPFNSNALFNVVAQGDSVPAVELRDAARLSAIDLMADAATIGAWVVNSGADDTFYPVAGGWVDTAWDTQRRRGTAPSARTTF